MALRTGGAGNDVLTGTSSPDTIYGLAGFDGLYGGSDADTLYGGDGGDALDAGSGDDRLFGGSGDDELVGDAGNDVIDGGNEHDIAFGGSGSDSLYGGAGSDTLYGEQNNDLLVGGAGNDALYGGNGFDVAVFGGIAAQATVIGTPGVNAIVTVISSDGVDVLYNVEQVQFTGVSAAPTISGDNLGDVTEDNLLTDSGTLSIVDPDPGQSSFQPASGSASFGSWSVNSAGAWTYNLSNTLTAVQSLGAGQTITDGFTVLSADGTPTAVKVVIHGNNDAASIGGATSGNATEDMAGAVTGHLAISDVDSGEASFQATSGTAGFGSWTMASNGNWSYSLNNGLPSVQGLGASATLADSFMVKSADGTTAAVQITIHGSNDPATIGGTASGNATEDIAGAASGQLSVADVDNGEASFQATSGTAGFGSWAIASDGNWSYALNSGLPAVQALGAGATLADSFIVRSADGTTATVQVTIHGSNDSATIDGTSTGDATEDAFGAATGQLSVTDVDSGEASFQATSGTAAFGSWTIDSAGDWSYSVNNGLTAVQALGASATLADSFTVKSADGTTASVQITIHGSNDPATIGGATSGDATEDIAAAFTGHLSIADVDTGEANFQATSGTAGFGAWSVDAGGNWSYLLDSNQTAVQALHSGGTLDDSFTVRSADGTTAAVHITIHGSDDAATIGGQTAGDVTEDQVLAATGHLTVDDPDSGDASFTPQTVTAGFGSFTLASNGDWSYALANASPSVQGLAAGATHVDSFTVHSADGTPSAVQVTVHGTNDTATIGGATSGDVTEDVATQTTGHLTVVDADSGQAAIVPDSGTASFGSWSVDASGDWQYSLNNALPDVQTLGVGEQITDSFVVQSADGSSTATVHIAIHGNNDAPEIATTGLTGSVTEDATLTADGIVSASDLDGDDVTFSSSSTAQHGSFTIDSDGTWHYLLNNTDPVVQALASGSSLVETFAVTASDGHDTDTATVTVTVQGVDEPASPGGVAFVGYEGILDSDLWVWDGTNVTNLQVNPAGGSFPAELTSLGDAIYFRGTDASGDEELWRFNGTSLLEINVNPDGPSHPDLLTTLGNALYFSATGADGNSHLWRFDGTDLTQITGIGGYAPNELTTFDGSLYISANLGSTGDLWVFDGSTATNLTPNPGDPRNPESLTPAGNALYFTGLNAGGNEELWKYGGTAFNEINIQGAGLSFLSQLTAVGNDLFFTASGPDGNGLWIYHGTALTEITPSAGVHLDSSWLTPVGNALYFSAYDGNESELWRYANGTLTEIDINPSGSSSPEWLTAVGDTLYLAADDDSERELWAVDGTNASKIDVTASGSSFPSDLSNVGGVLYFAAGDAFHRDLWTYDGTDLESVQSPVQASSSPNEIVATNNGLFFAATDSDGDNELWTFDGVDPAKIDINPLGSSQPYGLVTDGSVVYFAATASGGDVELWKSDGTTTTEIDVNPAGSSYPDWLTMANGVLYFTADDENFDTEIFKYNGSTLAEIDISASGLFSPEMLTAVGSTLYFSAFGNDGFGLWKYNGSSLSEVLTPTNHSLMPVELTPIGDTLFLSAYDGTDTELWTYDGSTATKININTSFHGSSFPRDFVSVDDTVYFVATDASHDTELWSYDGATASKIDVSPTGSSMPGNLTPIGDALLFQATDASGDSELWRYENGVLTDLNLNPTGSSDPGGLTVVGNAVYFGARSADGDVEVWRYDGATGTANEIDINPTGSSFPDQFVAFEGRLYFRAWSQNGDNELWVYDGTNATEVDINPALAGFSPTDITGFGTFA